MAQPHPLFHLIWSFCTENLSSHQDSNPDHRSRRQEHWPLDHHHSPIIDLTEKLLLRQGDQQHCSETRLYQALLCKLLWQRRTEVAGPVCWQRRQRRGTSGRTWASAKGWSTSATRTSPIQTCQLKNKSRFILEDLSHGASFLWAWLEPEVLTIKGVSFLLLYLITFHMYPSLMFADLIFLHSF